MFGLGAGEIFIIFVFALIFIGPKKLPELAKGLGKGIREFQKAKNEIMTDVNDVDLNSNFADATLSKTKAQSKEPSTESSEDKNKDS